MIKDNINEHEESFNMDLLKRLQEVEYAEQKSSGKKPFFDYNFDNEIENN